LSKGIGSEVWSVEDRVRLYLKSYGSRARQFQIYKLQNSYMTQGFYSFSEGKTRVKWKEHSEAQMEQNRSKTIRARGTDRMEQE